MEFGREISQVVLKIIDKLEMISYVNNHGTHTKKLANHQ